MPHVLGDIDGDGKVDNGDVIRVRNQRGRRVTASNILCDIDGNGVIDDRDVSACLALRGSSRRVYVVAMDGDDTGPGTIDHPLASPQRAADLARPGDVVIIRGGTYRGGSARTHSGALEIYRSGEPGLPIVYRAWPGEHPIIDAGATQFYALRLGSPIGTTGIKHVVIDGITATKARRVGIHVQNGEGIVIRNCTAYRNNQDAETFGTNGTWAGIGLYASTNCLVERCRSYYNGYGIWLRENVETDDPVGCTDCVVRDCFIYSNACALPGKYGNCSGVALRFCERVTLERNVLWDNPDGGINGLGNVLCRIVGNASLHAWQEPGNMTAIKLCVRGGGGNLIAFNVAAFNGSEGYFAGNGVGEIVLNQTSYGNSGWGYFWDTGRCGFIFNAIGYGNKLESPTSYPKELRAWLSNAALDPCSDYNFLQDEKTLPVLGGGYTQPHTLAGEPGLADPRMIFPEASPTQIVHPDDLFADTDGDGKVGIEEAVAQIAARYALRPDSPARGAGASLAEVQARIQAAVPNVIAALQARIEEYSQPPYDGGRQYEEAKSKYRRLIGHLQTEGCGGFGDLSGLSDFAGTPLSMNQPLHMGAVQEMRHA